MTEPLDLITAIRESFDIAVDVYTQGSCFKFFLILQTVFPDAEPWYDMIAGHVYAEINGRFYDIHGEHAIGQCWIKLKDEPHIYQDAPNWIWALEPHAEVYTHV